MSPRSEIVNTELPVEVYGAIMMAEISIRPTCDESCPGNVSGIVADVSVEGAFKVHPCSDENTIAILKRIKAEQPEVWREIEAKAEENHLEGLGEDREPVSYAPHFAEDELPYLEIPR